MAIRRTGTLLALPLTLWHAGDARAEYVLFPTQPALKDQLYLLHPSGCGDQEVPASPPTLHRSTDPDGSTTWRLQYAVRPSDCSETAPATVHAFALPDEVATSITDTLWVQRYSADTGQALPITLLWLRERVGIPPSVTGTWISPQHADQGLMLVYDERQQLAATWTTFAADGSPAWMAGIAPVPMDAPRMTVPLVSPLSGAFAGGTTLAPEVDAWGDIELEYTGCGALQLRWAPYPATGLAAGAAPLHQLTGNASAHCDLAAWAGAQGMVVIEHVPEVIDDDA